MTAKSLEYKPAGSTLWNDDPGEIYLLRCGKFYKIGMTRGLDVNARIKTFKCGNPYDIVCVHSFLVSYAKYTEGLLHSRFATKRIRNEWFKLSKSDVRWFCCLTYRDFE